MTALVSSAPEVDAKDAPADLRPGAFRILSEHCWTCHDAAHREGGLRLDSLAGLKEGGFSGQSLLDVPLESNELSRRLASADPAYRMPKGNAPLAEVDQKLLRDWLVQGAPWPEELISERKNRQEFFSQTFWARLGRTLNGQSAEVPFVQGMFALLLAIVVLTLGATRLRSVIRVRAEQVAPPGRWARSVIGWRPRHGWLLGVLVLTGCSVSWLWHEYQQRGDVIETLRERLRLASLPRRSIRAVYGAPPKPVRPLRPANLERVYYRGNLDRHPALPNGGNYRTATFGLSIRNADGGLLQVGDSVATGKVIVRLEMDRAAFQSDAILNDRTVAQLFLSARDLTGREEPRPSDSIGFTAVESGQHWVAEYTLVVQGCEAQGGCQGVIYVYRAASRLPLDAPRYAECQYGINYELPIHEQHVQAGADVWMGPLYVSDTLALPQPLKVPLEEWLSDRPIPELTDRQLSAPYLPGGPRAFEGFGTSSDSD